ncbi:MAG TPA: alkaline phosphatase family protein [Candidatus Dormibacteraeota bacterium]
MIPRRTFLKAAGAVAGLAVTEPWRAVHSLAAPRLAQGTTAFDHVVVLMMENRSWDHFMGWLPGANGVQAGLQYTDTAGTTYPTYPLAPDFQGCGYADPDHSWEGGVKQLNGGRVDGFLKTAVPGDTFPIGYYTEQDVPVLAALAKNYTISDNYFCSILAETYPNRFYQHAAQTDRDHNNFNVATIPTVWDLLATAGLSGRYYHSDLPFLALWGTKYASIMRDYNAFFAADCAAGNLPNVAFVDPSFNGESQGVSQDSHPHGDIRAGETFIADVYHAVRSSPNWAKTVMILNFDEWGGFYDHVVPPRVIDDHVGAGPGPHPDYHQLGFRVPNVVISPFAHRGRVVSSGAPFDHTSVLRMIEWRWGLPPLNARDANARNLADMLNFSLNRTDNPVVPSGTMPISVACLPGAAAHPPAPVSGTGGAGQSGGGPGAGSGNGGGLPNTTAALIASPAVAVGTTAVAAAGLGARALARRRRGPAAAAPGDPASVSCPANPGSGRR